MQSYPNLAQEAFACVFSLMDYQSRSSEIMDTHKSYYHLTP